MHQDVKLFWIAPLKYLRLKLKVILNAIPRCPFIQVFLITVAVIGSWL